MTVPSQRLASDVQWEPAPGTGGIVPDALEQRYVEIRHVPRLDPKIGLRQRMEGRHLDSAPIEVELRRVAQERLEELRQKGQVTPARERLLQRFRTS